jgi:hypothetical protein
MDRATELEHLEKAKRHIATARLHGSQSLSVVLQKAGQKASMFRRLRVRLA